MSSRVVDGVALPLPVAGHPALDFCNTRAGWNAEQPKEYLTGFTPLALWCREFDLLTPAASAELIALADREPATGQAVLHQALALRDALYLVILGRGDLTQWARVAAAAEAARAAGRLIPGGHGEPARWQPHWPGLSAPVLAVAEAAGDLLTGPLAGTVGACPGEGCGWLFADPRRRRRWCSMAVCGNRAKARRHRAG